MKRLRVRFRGSNVHDRYARYRANLTSSVELSTREVISLMTLLINLVEGPLRLRSRALQGRPCGKPAASPILKYFVLLRVA